MQSQTVSYVSVLQQTLPFTPAGQGKAAQAKYYVERRHTRALLWCLSANSHFANGAERKDDVFGLADDATLLMKCEDGNDLNMGLLEDGGPYQPTALDGCDSLDKDEAIYKHPDRGQGTLWSKAGATHAITSGGSTTGFKEGLFKQGNYGTFARLQGAWGGLQILKLLAHDPAQVTLMNEGEKLLRSNDFLRDSDQPQGCWLTLRLSQVMKKGPKCFAKDEVSGGTPDCSTTWALSVADSGLVKDAVKRQILRAAATGSEKQVHLLQQDLEAAEAGLFKQYSSKYGLNRMHEKLVCAALLASDGTLVRTVQAMRGETLSHEGGSNSRRKEGDERDEVKLQSEKSPCGRYIRQSLKLFENEWVESYEAYDGRTLAPVIWNTLKTSGSNRTAEEVEGIMKGIRSVSQAESELKVFDLILLWKSKEAEHTYVAITEKPPSLTLREHSRNFSFFRLDTIKQLSRQALKGFQLLNSRAQKVSHAQISNDNMYIGQGTGDLKIGTYKTLFEPLLKSEEERYLETEGDDVTNFGLILLEMLTQESRPMADVDDEEKLKELIEGLQSCDEQTKLLITRCLSKQEKPKLKELLELSFFSQQIDINFWDKCKRVTESVQQQTATSDVSQELRKYVIEHGDKRLKLDYPGSWQFPKSVGQIMSKFEVYDSNGQMTAESCLGTGTLYHQISDTCFDDEEEE